MAHYSMVSHNLGGLAKGRNVGWKELISNIVEQQKEEKEDTITINIGGELFRTSKETFKRFPGSRLAQLDKSSGHYESKTRSYFFDRNPIMFRYIIDYYKTGELHIPLHICPRMVEQDLYYWGIQLTDITDCCKNVLEENVANLEAEEHLMNEYFTVPQNVYSLNSKDFSEYLTNWRTRVWELLDDHKSSTTAKIWHIGYMFLVVLSILSFFIGSIESCRVPLKDSIYRTGIYQEPNVTDEPPKIKRLLTTSPHPSLQIIELSCLLFFSIEFVFRFAVCPWKIRLLKTAYTFIDLLYILPVWTVIFVEVTHGAFWQTKNGHKVFIVIKTIEIFRVLRIFRFIKHHRGLRVLYLALKNSSSELLLLVVFVAFNTTIFASFIYCTEAYSPEYFQNAFQGMWWSLVTMTTVGYGDMYPQSLLGYVVGGMCALTGIIMIQMPIPIIVSNFHSYYGLNIPEKDRVTGVKADEPASPDIEIESSDEKIQNNRFRLLNTRVGAASTSPVSSNSQLITPEQSKSRFAVPFTFNNKVDVVVDPETN